MPAIRRLRSLVNNGVDVEAHKDVRVKCLRAPPQLDIKQKFGPVLCSDIRQVTAEAFKATKSLIDSLIAGGLQNGTMQAWKFQFSLQSVISHSPAWCANVDVAQQAELVTKHVQVVRGRARECK